MGTCAKNRSGQNYKVKKRLPVKAKTGIMFAVRCIEKVLFADFALPETSTETRQELVR